VNAPSVRTTPTLMSDEQVRLSLRLFGFALLAVGVAWFLLYGIFGLVYTLGTWMAAALAFAGRSSRSTWVARCVLAASSAAGILGIWVLVSTDLRGGVPEAVAGWPAAAVCTGLAGLGLAAVVPWVAASAPVAVMAVVGWLSYFRPGPP
jgi:hypothetical protein